MAEATPMAGTTPFSLGKLFEDPNFINLLAGVGASIDPTGVGGILGNATMKLVSSKQAQRAGEKTLNETGRDVVTRKLGPVTPIDREGPNSIKSNSNGSLDIDVNTRDSGKLVSTLGGYTPLGIEGVNRVTRTPRGSFLINYDPPKARSAAFDNELASLEAAPTAARDESKLSYTPVSQSALQTELDSTLEPFAGRRSRL